MGVGSVMDWAAFEAEFTAELMAFADDALATARAAGEQVYAVAPHLFYAESESIISLPPFAAATEEWLARQPAGERDALRWSPADWPRDADTWRRPGRQREWERALERAAAGDAEHWEAVHERYAQVVIAVCRSVALRLSGQGPAGGEILVPALDQDQELLPRTLTPEQARRYFPELVEAVGDGQWQGSGRGQDQSS